MAAKVDPFLVAGDVEPLERLLARVPQARGMYVRRRGRSLIIGRKERYGPRGGLVDDDRLERMALGRESYSLRFIQGNGRWAGTGVEGPLPARVDVICGLFAHCVTPPPVPRAAETSPTDFWAPTLAS